MATKEDLLSFAIGAVRAELSERLERFGETKLGRVVREGGRRVITAHREGRDVDQEILDMLEELPEMLDDESEEEES